MKHLSLALAACAALGAACDGGSDHPAELPSDAATEPGDDAAESGDASTGDGDAGTDTAYLLTDWVHALVEERSTDEAEPDTVDDKRIIDTDDPSAFDAYL